MPFHPRARTLARPLGAALAGLLVLSCATTNLPPIRGAGFHPTEDEVALWHESRLEEEKLRSRVWLFDDPQLHAYLGDLVADLASPAMAENEYVDYRLEVVDDAALNAFAYPHGALYVHTGLLARMENEAQLATVLAHEMSHVEQRHMLRFRRSARNKEIALLTASIATAVILEHEEWKQWKQGDWGEAELVGTLGDVVLGLGLHYAFLAAVNGYGRDLELEADRAAFAKLERAGYAPAQAPRAFELLLEGSGGDDGRVETFFFGSHPRLERRIESAREWAQSRLAAAGAGEVATSSATATPGAGDVVGTAAPASREAEGPRLAVHAADAPPAPATPAALDGERRDGDGAAPGTVGDDGAVVPARSNAGTPPSRSGSAAGGSLGDTERFRRALLPVVLHEAGHNLDEGYLALAEEQVHRALAWAPDDAEAHWLLARLHLAWAEEAVTADERGALLADAEELLRRAVLLNVNLPGPHRELGFLLYDEGELAAACRQLGFYLELSPDAEDASLVEEYVWGLQDRGLC